MARHIGVSYPTYLHHRTNPDLGLEPPTLGLYRIVLGEAALSLADIEPPSTSPTMRQL